MTASSRAARAVTTARTRAVGTDAREVTPRPRLDGTLDAWLGVPVVLVVGPPGSGRSTLVAHWAQHAVARRLVAGVHVVAPGAAGALPGPGLRTRRDAADRPALYVVEDPDPAAGRALDDLVELACDEPDRVHVVVTSRTSRGLRALTGLSPDRLRVLTADQLALTPAEATAVVRARWPAATAHDVAQLHAATRGWVGLVVEGVRLLSAAGAPPPGALARALATGHASARLAAGCVAALAPADRAAVVALCAAGTFDAADAAALTGRADLDLAALRDAGLLTPVADGRGPRPWQVHPVLREHLLDAARPGTPAGRAVATAHARAFGHLARLGQPVRALEHAVATHDVETVAYAVAELGPALVALGRSDVLVPARLRLPGSTHAQDPSLLAVEALRLRAAGDVAGALAVGQAAFERSAADPPDDRPVDGAARLQADLALLDLWVARHGWVDPAAALSAAGRLLDDASLEAHPELSLARRAWLAVELGAVLMWTDAVSEAALQFERAATLVEGTDYVHIRASALASRALAELVDGALQSAAATAGECLALTAPTPSHPLYVARADTAAAWVAYHRWETPAAVRHLDAAERGNAGDRDPLVQVLTALLRARLSADAGAFDEAWRVLASRAVLRPDLPPFLARMVHVVRAEVYVAQRNVTGLRGEAAALRERRHTEDADLFDAVAAMVAGDLEGGRRTLEALTSRTPRYATTGLAATACLVHLLLHTRAEGVEPALRDLLSRVWSTGAVRFLAIGLAAGPAFTQALRREAADPDGHPWADEALAVLRRVAPEDVAPDPAPDGPHLTPRELAVLRGLAAGRSYTEVARTLFITPNTVKTHVSSLYRKLGVERASHAVRTARRQGVLPPVD